MACLPDRQNLSVNCFNKNAEEKSPAFSFYNKKAHLNVPLIYPFTLNFKLSLSKSTTIVSPFLNSDFRILSAISSSIYL